MSDLCRECGQRDDPVNGCACGCDFTVIYCQGCGACPAANDSFTACIASCDVQAFPPSQTQGERIARESFDDGARGIADAAIRQLHSREEG